MQVASIAGKVTFAAGAALDSASVYAVCASPAKVAELCRCSVIALDAKPTLGLALSFKLRKS